MAKRATDEEIRNRLQVPGPRRNGPQVTELTPPNEEMPIFITLDQLKPYENNPRKVRNPMYDDIKESIRAVGLNHSPVITKRPNDSKYTIRDGGNTRLQILNELYEETGEERFYKIWCIYRPWESEIRSLAGHLSENDNRGQLLFIERALALVEAKKLYEEQEGKEISQREFVKMLADDGYKVHRSNLVQMFNTVEHILPSMPETLYAGMGRDQIVKLLSYRSIYLQIWSQVAEQLQTVQVEEFQPAFHEILAHFDSPESPELPWKLMLDHFLNMLNERTGVHYNILELVIDNLQIYKQRGWRLEDAIQPLVNELEDMKNPRPRIYFNGAGQPIPDPNAPPSAQESNLSQSAPQTTPKTPISSEQSATDIDDQFDFDEEDDAVSDQDNSSESNFELSFDQDHSNFSDVHHAHTAGSASHTTVAFDTPAAPLEDPLDVVMNRSDEEKEQLRQSLTLAPSGEKNTFKMFRHMMQEQYGYKPHDFEDLAPLAIPLQAGGEGIAPVTDLWLISPHLDTLDKVRIVVHEFAKAIGQWAGFKVYHQMEKVDVGFELEPLADNPSRRAQMTWQLLASLLGEVNPEYPNDATIYAELLGTIDSDDNWPDIILVRFFRLIRLVRHARTLIQQKEKGR